MPNIYLDSQMKELRGNIHSIIGHKMKPDFQGRELTFLDN